MGRKNMAMAEDTARRLHSSENVVLNVTTTTIIIIIVKDGRNTVMCC